MADTIDAVTNAQLVDQFTWDDRLPMIDRSPRAPNSATTRCASQLAVQAGPATTPTRSSSCTRRSRSEPATCPCSDSCHREPTSHSTRTSCSRQDAVSAIRFSPDRPDLAQKDFANLAALLDAANQDIAAHNEQGHATVRRSIEERAAGASAERQAVHSTGWQVRRVGESPVAYRIQDRKRSSSRPRRPPPTDENDFQLDRRDSVEVLQCIASWADSAERQPGVAAGAGEDELRNALLATLKARFVDGTGEAFSVSRQANVDERRATSRLGAC